MLSRFPKLIYLLVFPSLFEASPVKVIEKRQGPRNRPDCPVVPAYNISLPIDHFDSRDDRTFQNRYWINDTFWKQGGPVFFFDFGEKGVTDLTAAFYLAEHDGPSAVMQLAQKHHGMAVGWEHRFFGLSLPFPLALKDGTATDPFTCAANPAACTHKPIGGTRSYQYLTIDQALEDVIYFAHHFQPPGYSLDQAVALSPGQAPWIWLGGSYPGSRAVWARLRNPETFYVSWASSAPLEFRADGSSYFIPIQRTLKPDCSADVIASIKYADEVLSGDYGKKAFDSLQTSRFITEAVVIEAAAAGTTAVETQNLTTADIGRLLSYPLSINFQDFGPRETTNIFCSLLESYNPASRPTNTSSRELATLTHPRDRSPSSIGIAQTFNASTALEAYLYAGRKYLAHEQAFNTYPENPLDEVANDAAWRWLLINELGMFLGSNPNNITIVSKFWNFTAVSDYYKSWYNFDTSDGCPSAPNVSAALKYGGWNASPSNVMFTDGEFDPWRSFAVTSQESQIGAPCRDVVQTVPPCNIPPQGTQVFGKVYPGGVHGKGFSGESEQDDEPTPFSISLDLFNQALDVWLLCFKDTQV